MRVGISRVLLDRLLAEAAAAPGVEVCGLLLGEPGRIADAVPAANVAADPARAFEIDPRVLIDQAKAERAGGPRMIGHYHSHPNGSPEPSPRDAAAAEGKSLWLMLAGGEARLWRSGEPGGLHNVFAAVALAIAPPPLA